MEGKIMHTSLIHLPIYCRHASFLEPKGRSLTHNFIIIHHVHNLKAFSLLNAICVAFKKNLPSPSKEDYGYENKKNFFDESYLCSCII